MNYSTFINQDFVQGNNKNKLDRKFYDKIKKVII
jgi:hypothetical protein